MPTISLSFPSLLNSPLSSYFLPTTTTTNNNTNNPPTIVSAATTTTTSSPPPPPTKTKMEAVELRRIFEMFDVNGDGRISKGELTESLRNMGIFIPDSDLSHMIDRIDTNGDGCVDREEFQALYSLIMEEREGGPEAVDDEEDIREAFNVFDKNGDGFITVDELRSVLGSLGLNQGQSLDDCKLMIMKVDVDGDGKVSFTEFKKMMKEGGFAALN